jgi:hypothetical protein
MLKMRRITCRIYKLKIMKAIELYRFITENDIEYHYRDNNGTEDVIIFPYTFQIDEFSELLKSYDYCDGGIECFLMDGYFAIWMKDVCEYYGIELSEVFDKDEYND